MMFIKRTQHVRKSTGKCKTKMKVFNAREAKKIVERNGWELRRIQGSHYIYKHPRNKKILTISKDLNRMVWERLVGEYNIDLNV